MPDAGSRSSQRGTNVVWAIRLLFGCAAVLGCGLVYNFLLVPQMALTSHASSKGTNLRFSAALPPRTPHPPHAHAAEEGGAADAHQGHAHAAEEITPGVPQINNEGLAASAAVQRQPVKVVRRTSRDPVTGEQVIEETSYFLAPKGSGDALAAALEEAGELGPADEIYVSSRSSRGSSSRAHRREAADLAAEERDARNTVEEEEQEQLSDDYEEARRVRRERKRARRQARREAEELQIAANAAADAHAETAQREQEQEEQQQQQQQQEEAAEAGHEHSHAHGKEGPKPPLRRAPTGALPPPLAPSEVAAISTPVVAAWQALPNPMRESSWVQEQRPIAGEADVTVGSHVLAESAARSMNPPRALSEYSSPEQEELSHRLVIAVALGVHSGSFRSFSPGDKESLKDLPLIKVMLESFLPTAQPHHAYRFYFAFDHNDRVYEQEANRRALEELYAQYFAAEEQKRWHPDGSKSGVIDGSRLVHSVHWVHCDYSGKPSWAHSDAVVAAVKEGADYVYRSNDDSKFPEIKDWADRFIVDLRGRKPMPNLGVTGPACGEGATWILTHDFTHRTHTTIFGFQYPRALPDWSSDDWITYVYEQFGLMSKQQESVVGHTFVLGTRYNPTDKTTRLAMLNAELRKGAESLTAWLKGRNLEIPFTLKHVDCC